LGRALAPFGSLSTGKLMLPAPHGRKEEGRKGTQYCSTSSRPTSHLRCGQLHV